MSDTGGSSIMCETLITSYRLLDALKSTSFSNLRLSTSVKISTFYHLTALAPTLVSDLFRLNLVDKPELSGEL